MSDGEVMERLWSYLRPTAKITKEMALAHRVDTLTDFLMHYAKKSISNLGNLAVNLHVLQIQLSPQYIFVNSIVILLFFTVFRYSQKFRGTTS